MADGVNSTRLQHLFRQVVAEMASNLDGCADELRASAGEPVAAAQKAYVIAHSLHGAGALYGFPSVTELGASLEKMLRAVQEGTFAAPAEAADLLAASATALRAVADSDAANNGAAAKVRSVAWECECALHDDRPQAPEQDATA
jgi:chemotaxis protein histidine kinase CheA